MGKSKGRKKKKKYQQKKSSKQKNNLGISFNLQGNKLFFKTDRTEEEQDLMNRQMLESKPKILTEINKNIDRVVEIFTNYDRFILLGSLFVHSYFKTNDPNDDGKSEIILEYGHSFALAIDLPISFSKPSKKIIQELTNLLEEIRFKYNYLIMIETVENNYTKEESHLRFITISEALFMRGDGYMKHLKEIYLELFSGHSDFLRDKYSFTAEDIFDCFVQFENSFYCRLLFPEKIDGLNMLIPHSAAMERFKQWQEDNKIESFVYGDKEPFFKFLKDNPDLSDDGVESNTYNIFKPEDYSKLFKLRFRSDIQKSIAEALSCEIGDNSDFVNPKFKGLPLNDSIQSLYPVIKYENEYFLFGLNLYSRNLFEITENLIKKADKDYYNNKYLGNDYSLSRDNYLESKVLHLFSKFIPDSVVMPNLKYSFYNEEGTFIDTELDLLVESTKTIYLIEMKAGGLSAPAKRGALKSLKSNISDIIDYGSFQNLRAINYITHSDNPSFKDINDTTITVDKSKKIFRITITLEHLSGYLVNLNDLIAIGAITNEMAWTCSLFDLMIFSEIIDNEDDFIDYLEKRIPLYADERIIINDEIDLLGYYIENGQLMNESELNGMDTFILHKYSTKIDDYIEKGGVKPTKKL